MDLSGIIFVVLALAWAVYLIPKALKHHDEMARTRSIDRFSNAMRVLARREPVNRRDTRLVVTPPRPGTPRMLVPQPHVQSQNLGAVAAVVASSEGTTTQAERSAGARSAGARPADAGSAGARLAARNAAKRRRRILLFLLLCTAVVAAVGGLGHLSWWSLSIPAGLTIAYLVLCRTQIRRQRKLAHNAPRATGLSPRRGIRADVSYGVVSTVNSDEGLEAAVEGEDTAAQPATVMETAATNRDDAAAVVVASETERESLWDPLPMTLPTYVSKPRASRTVRTIDLSQPNTWSSGRSEADSKLVEDTAAAHDAATKAAAEQRAVGS